MEETIRQIFVDELGCEVAALTPECRLREDLGVSSLEMLGVVLALEDQFSITIDEADLPGIATFQDVVASCPSSAEQPTATRALSPCWTPSWITCRRRWISMR